MELIEGCAQIAPTFLSLGNHEWMLHDLDLQLIASTGAVVLDNGWKGITVDGKKVAIGGLSAARFTEYKAFRAGSSELYPKPRSTASPHTPRSTASSRTTLTASFPHTGERSINKVSRVCVDLAWLDDFCSVPEYKILLCHHPEYWSFLRSRKLDLVLSGHAHGGQWRIMGRGVYAPGQGLFPKLTSGVVENRLLISRGLANTTIIPRINNPVEIVYVLPTHFITLPC